MKKRLMTMFSMATVFVMTNTMIPVYAEDSSSSSVAEMTSSTSETVSSSSSGSSMISANGDKHSADQTNVGMTEEKKIEKLDGKLELSKVDEKKITFSFELAEPFYYTEKNKQEFKIKLIDKATNQTIAELDSLAFDKTIQLKNDKDEVLAYTVGFHDLEIESKVKNLDGDYILLVEGNLSNLEGTVKKVELKKEITVVHSEVDQADVPLPVPAETESSSKENEVNSDEVGMQSDMDESQVATGPIGYKVIRPSTTSKYLPKTNTATNLYSLLGLLTLTSSLSILWLKKKNIN